MPGQEKLNEFLALLQRIKNEIPEAVKKVENLENTFAKLSTGAANINQLAMAYGQLIRKLNELGQVDMSKTLRAAGFTEAREATLAGLYGPARLQAAFERAKERYGWGRPQPEEPTFTYPQQPRGFQIPLVPEIDLHTIHMIGAYNEAAKKQFIETKTTEELLQQNEEVRKQLKQYETLTSSVDIISQRYNAITKELEVQYRIIKDISGITPEGKYAEGTAILESKGYVTPEGFTELSPAQREFQKLLGGSDQALQFLQQYGIGIENITRSYKDASRGITHFIATTADGLDQITFQVDKFGKATLATGRNVTDLFSNISRNITKVIEWAAATGLVYGAIRQLSEAISSMSGIEEVFADLSIITNETADSLQRYYDAALEVANLTSTDVVQALEAQRYAFAASAGEADRFAAANELLLNSMTLARLSGMEQAESLDLLIGGLRQTGRSFEEASELLDGWVAVSKVAKVTISDLAHALATVGAVSEEVGVSIDELNGLVAVLNESTGLSAQESANALRTMFSNITSPEAVNTLRQYGIAVYDINGQMRDWMSIIQDISNLSRAGVLNEEQINRLANAIGGGSRRGPQLLAILQNIPRVNQLAAISANANGDAMEALAAKSETLTAAVTELSNAFNALVESVGFQGGAIDILTAFVRVATDVVNAIREITNALGGSTGGILLGFGAMALGQTIATRTNLGSLFGRQQQVIGGAVVPPTGLYSTGMYRYLTEAPANRLQWSAQGVAGGLLGGAPVVATEIARALSGEQDAWGRAGGALAGAAVGGMVGMLTGPAGAAIGGSIGATIGDMIVGRLEQRQEFLRSLIQGTFAEQPAPTQLRQIMEQYRDVLGTGVFGPLRQVGMTPGWTDEEIVRTANRIVQSSAFAQAQARYQEIIAAAPLRRGARAAAEVQATEAARAILEEAGYTGEELTIAVSAIKHLTTDELNNFIQATSTYLETATNAVEEAQQQLENAIAERVAAIQASPAARALAGRFEEQRIAALHEITTSTTDYTQQREAAEAAAIVTAQLFEALGIEADQLAENTEEWQHYLEVGESVSQWTSDQIQNISALIASINDHREAIAELEAQLEEQADSTLEERLNAEREALEAETLALQQNTEAFTLNAQIRQAREQFQEMLPTRLPETVTANQIAQWVQQAKEQQQIYLDYLGIPPDVAERMFDPIYIQYGETIQRIDGLSKEFFQSDFMQYVNDAAEALNQAFTLQNLDVSSEMIPWLQQRANQIQRWLEASFGQYGYDEQAQNIGVITSDKQARVLNTTMTALTLAIQELTDVEKKQLEGMWNLPAGVTAYVPITSLFYAQQGQQEDMRVAGELQNQAAELQNQAAQKNLEAATYINVALRNRMIQESEIEALYPKKPSREELARGSQLPVGSSLILQIDGKNIASTTNQYQATQFINRVKARGYTIQ